MNIYNIDNNYIKKLTSEDTFDSKLRRFKEATNLKTDLEVADLLNIKQSTFSQQKKRNDFPIKNVKELAKSEKWKDLDTYWIFTGMKKDFAKQISNCFQETSYKEEIFDLYMREATKQLASLPKTIQKALFNFIEILYEHNKRFEDYLLNLDTKRPTL